MADDSPRSHPEAALAALVGISLLFAAAGVATWTGLLEVELEAFGWRPGSPAGLAAWITASLLVAGGGAWLLRRRLARGRQEGAGAATDPGPRERL